MPPFPPKTDHPFPNSSGSLTVALTGFPGSGKTVYLAALYNELLHAGKLTVHAGSAAFYELVRAYWELLLQGALPGRTRERVVEPIALTLRGEDFRVDIDFCDDGPDVFRDLARGEAWGTERGTTYLRCDAILLAVSCNELLTGAPPARGGAGPKEAAEHDFYLSRLFYELLERKGRLRQVVVVLVGIDRFGGRPARAASEALAAFDATFRVFPGVLKNKGVRVDVVPVSNFGFHFSPAWGEELPAAGHIRPYNVLEPLRRLVQPEPPWWRRWVWRLRGARPFRLRDLPAESTADPAAASGPYEAFISYRREGGAETARLIRKELEARGRRIFLDVDDLGSSLFDERLLREIAAAPNFVVILSPGALDRCAEEGDWLRREIAQAVKTGRNVIPVLKDGFQFPPAEALPADIRELPRNNAVPYSHVYFQAAVDKLHSFFSR